MKKERWVLISVWNKDGLEPLLKSLSHHGYEFISSSGTADYIKKMKYKVRKVETVTGYPEILNGRVKTLHPNIHGGILAPRTPEALSEIKDQGITPIEMVIVNLYPFWEYKNKGLNDKELIEYIDIGGPAMLRAAAKNYHFVLPVPSPQFYEELIKELDAHGGEPGEDFRKKMMAETFSLTSAYDGMIAGHFSSDRFPSCFALCGKLVQTLRYGENPHQGAALYKTSGGIPTFEKLQGKELSYNNILDLDACVRLYKTFCNDQRCFTAILKHNNPCGLALADDPVASYRGALSGDPVSAFGGIVVSNREIAKETASEMKKLFLEIILAPGFSKDALEILKSKKNLRLLCFDPHLIPHGIPEIKSVNGGFLVQDENEEFSSEFEFVTEMKPAGVDLEELIFAQRIVKHLKSNAISITKEHILRGAGMGQVSRVDAVQLALSKAAEKAKGAYLASDAFFPFPDCLELAAKSGIRAVIQPGGSVNDNEVVEKANALGLIMVFTGQRHFWH
ncbi:MAG: bifunctional phosphoribosylaminoimidazolecarboxamide formyltransferase/IMP cyclohydrolase [Candidatus Wallbacteria bacterium]|nr:bifunctional phosphoribosylaminoimidazolecarboxamide formyltransferase/IMP cyclohydrolase [Candidatus Wallbacteria bacterium]